MLSAAAPCPLNLRRIGYRKAVKSSIQQLRQILDIPKMLGDARGHRWRDLERLMDAAEIVIHEVQRNRRFVVLDLLAERIGQASEAAHSHPHGEVLTLDMGCRNVLLVGRSANPILASPGAF